MVEMTYVHLFPTLSAETAVQKKIHYWDCILDSTNMEFLHLHKYWPKSALMETKLCGTIVLPGGSTIKSVQFLFIKGKLNLEENHQRSFTVISTC